MPYWTYARVKDMLYAKTSTILSRDLWESFSPDMKETITILGKILLNDQATFEQYIKYRNEILDALVELLMKREPQINTQKFRLMAAVDMLDLIGDAITKQLTNVDRPRFFLEPTIASALTEASVSNITRRHLPDTIPPISIYLPPGIGLIPSTPNVRTRAIHIVSNPVEINDGKDVEIKLLSLEETDEPDEKYHYTTMVLDLAVDKDRSLDYVMDGKVINITGIAEPDGTTSTVLSPRLLVNVLLYWMSEDADILRSLNPNYDKARTSMLKASGKKREKKKSALKKIPREEHMILGTHLDILRRRAERTYYERKENPEKTGRRPRQHHRRSHWWWCPCGPNRERRKLQWRVISSPVNADMPTIEKAGFSVRS